MTAREIANSPLLIDFLCLNSIWEEIRTKVAIISIDLFQKQNEIDSTPEEYFLTLRVKFSDELIQSTRHSFENLYLDEELIENVRKTEEKSFREMLKVKDKEQNSCRLPEASNKIIKLYIWCKS